MAINCKKECNKALTSQSKLIFKEMWVHCKKTNKKKIHNFLETDGIRLFH